MKETDRERGDSEAAVLAAISDVAREHLGWTTPITRETRLVQALALDSIRLLTLVIEVENRFRIRLDGDFQEAPETAGDLVDAIREKLRDQPSAGAGSPSPDGW